MSKSLRCMRVVSLLGATAFAWVAGCSSTNSPPASSGSSGTTGSATGSSTGSTGQTGTTGGTGSTGTGSGTSSGSTGSTTGSSVTDSGSYVDALSYSYTLIDDMETTTHGPIEYAGIMPPETPAYWFNFGGTAMGDVMTPTYQSFVFSDVVPPTTTYNGKTSAHAAHQVCALNGLYDVCGIGVEFAQINDEDAAADAGCVIEPLDASLPDATVADGGDAGEAGPPICKVTVPFDISQYKGIAFWAKAGDLGDAGAVDMKVIFPDPDTDPRGGICNSAAAGAGGPTDTTQCYDSYAETVELTGDWQEFVVLFSDLQLGTFGWVTTNPFNEMQVYGINFQEQDNDASGSPTDNFDFWIDDLYFIK
jgi:hypothetical protein